MTPWQRARLAADLAARFRARERAAEALDDDVAAYWRDRADDATNLALEWDLVDRGVRT